MFQIQQTASHSHNDSSLKNCPNNDARERHVDLLLIFGKYNLFKEGICVQP